MEIINIENKNKAEVLAKLFNNSIERSLFGCFIKRRMSIEEAENVLMTQTYFDYFDGAVMKIDLSKNDLRIDLYDRDVGEGEAKRIIETCMDIE